MDGVDGWRRCDERGEARERNAERALKGAGGERLAKEEEEDEAVAFVCIPQASAGGGVMGSWAHRLPGESRRTVQMLQYFTVPPERHRSSVTGSPLGLGRPNRRVYIVSHQAMIPL